MTLVIMHELTIGGTVVLRQADPTDSDSVLLAPMGRIELTELERTYDDPAQLSFVLYRPWTEQTFAADDLVTLEVVDTDPRGDREIVFSGLLDPVRPRASLESGNAQLYTARDHGNALRQPRALNSNGRAGISLTAGQLASLVTEYLTHVGEEFDRVGVDTEVLYSGGAEAVECWPVSIDSESVDEGLRKIAAAAPGVSVFMDPRSGDRPQYHFVNVFNAPRRTITLDETRVGELSIAREVRDCYGAVGVFSFFEIGQYSDVRVRTLTPAWNPSLESQWVWAHSMTTDSGGVPDGLSEVFRRFSFASFASELQGVGDMVALVEGVKFTPPRYAQIRVASVDYTSRTLLLQQPAIEGLTVKTTARRNPNIPGKSKRTMTYLRFGLKGGSPIITDPVRVPADGFAGRAYELAPISCGCCKYINVPHGVSREDYAAAAFAALSEPRASGSIPVAGRLDVGLFFLGHRLSFATASHGLTNFEDLDAPMTGVSVDFRHGGSATVSFNRDHSSLLSEGG